MLTRAEIAKLKALAAADLRSVNSYVGWLVAQELSRPTPKRTASSVRGVNGRRFLRDKRTPSFAHLPSGSSFFESG
jgi:hypothetical protein